jgi:hypothetical protein
MREPSANAGKARTTLGYRWITDRHGKRKRIPIKEFNPNRYKKGRGSRITVFHPTRVPINIAVIKKKQDRAEKLAGMRRTGYGLFDNPLSDRPILIGYTKVPRKRQKNPRMRKLIAIAKGKQYYNYDTRRRGKVKRRPPKIDFGYGAVV